MHRSSGRGRRATAVVLAGLFALAALLAGCGGGDGADQGGGEAPSGETRAFAHEDFEIRFRYPQELELEDDFSFGSSGERGPEGSVGARLGVHDYFVAQRFKLNTEVTEDNLERFVPEANAVFSELAGEEVSGERTEVGGLPALRYEFDAAEAEEGSTESVVILDGETQYLLTCASTPAHRELIDAACDTAVDTLQPTG